MKSRVFTNKGPLDKQRAVIYRQLSLLLSHFILRQTYILNNSPGPVAVAVATGGAMSGGGFSFMSSIRLLPLRPVLFT